MPRRNIVGGDKSKGRFPFCDDMLATIAFISERNGRPVGRWTRSWLGFRNGMRDWVGRRGVFAWARRGQTDLSTAAFGLGTD